jgi:hypothetical protein
VKVSRHRTNALVGIFESQPILPKFTGKVLVLAAGVLFVSLLSWPIAIGMVASDMEPVARFGGWMEQFGTSQNPRMPNQLPRAAEVANAYEPTFPQ